MQSVLSGTNLIPVDLPTTPLLPPPTRTITTLEDQVRIEDTKINALLKKDDQNQLREIQLQEEAVVPSNIGITIIIPQSTKIFSPQENTGLQNTEPPTMVGHVNQDTPTESSEDIPTVVEPTSSDEAVQTEQPIEDLQQEDMQAPSVDDHVEEAPVISDSAEVTTPSPEIIESSLNE